MKLSGSIIPLPELLKIFYHQISNIPTASQVLFAIKALGSFWLRSMPRTMQLVGVFGSTLTNHF
ncbi:hypothetical protein H4Q26_005738 [Puccinia striiformis f. sp. tritici PST-130]|uniref:Uncharacterized protein n=1 Tax=Puccinia striiformis f. sp. tritici PST-78 TaxID=1165861 RepID=A0A0L0V6W6_9BASI|nr:hypothetical protein H4Q26_005738 [Puccinia striiformis f. sp. tritici PST-130]KNE94936.1 hypothetical protein PSTG_11727 [Puccinia striiformis f. sp. tritici PST-78]